MTVWVPRGKADSPFVGKEPGFGHAYGYDCNVSNRHVAHGFGDLSPSDIGRLRLCVAMHEQHVTREQIDCGPEPLLEIPLARNTPELPTARSPISPRGV